MKLATLCYLRKNNHTLMQYRNRANDIHYGKWNGVGGKFLPGETPEQCAIREIFEETGLIAKKLQLKGFITFPKFSNNEDWYVFVFLVTEFVGVLEQSSEGVLQWIPNEDLYNLPLWEGDKLFLQWLDKNEFFTACFVYKDGILLQYNVNFY